MAYHYAAHTPGVSAAANCTVKFDIDNVPQPDALLRILRECGGQSRVDDGDYLVGAPELIVEITASSTSIDLHSKLNVYRRNGVKEYLTWRTADGEFDWRTLVEGEYRLLTADAKGILRSSVFPGLWLAVSPLLERNSSAVLATLNAGLRSRAHKTFIVRLAARVRETNTLK
ncbi:MAG: Uma2 family endonuclease [Verrucomicrobiales bacterium]|nr:Uma2 family endonuclease [Verrucomicrobiales bacterium]